MGTSKVLVESSNDNSSITSTSFRIYPDPHYVVKFRKGSGETRQIELADLEEKGLAIFDSLPQVGFIEKGEIRAIKKVIDPLVEKLLQLTSSASLTSSK